MVHIAVAPLRERVDDISLLADFFLKKYAAREGKEGLRFELETYDWLRNQEWPGNVRQLQNMIEGAVAYTNREDTLRPKDFWDYGHRDANLTKKEVDLGKNKPNLTLKQATALFQVGYIRELMASHNGNMVRTAESLGVSRVNLYTLLARLSIDKDEFR